MLAAFGRKVAVSTAFFIYTLTLLVICVLTGAVSLSAYFVSRRKTFLLCTALFLFYLFDVALIFQSEFLSQNLAYDQSLFYTIENPYWKILMGGGFLAAMWFIVCDYLDEDRTAMLVGPLVVFVVCSLAVLWLLPEGSLHQFLFYTMRQVFMAGIALYIFVRYRRSTDAVERTRMERHRNLFIVFCVLIVCITAEDAGTILLADPSLFTADFPLYLSERNFSENVLLIVLMVVALRSSAQTLSLQFERPPQRENEPLQKHIDDLLPTYCRHHGLSDREGEVLRMILIGKDNQNIASEMQLAVGTVKAHVHNILKKTGQDTRQDLAQDFWKD